MFQTIHLGNRNQISLLKDIEQQESAAFAACYSKSSVPNEFYSIQIEKVAIQS